LNILSGLSLASCAAVVALWPWTYNHPLLVGELSWKIEGNRAVEQCVGLFSRRGELGFISYDHRVALSHQTSGNDRGTPFHQRGLIRPRMLYNGPPRDGDDPLIEMGFGFGEYSYNDRALALQDQRRYFFVPNWFLMLLLAAFPLIYGPFLVKRHWELARARMRGHCDHCGYDLRATPDRCPECGTVRTKT
jgi:hypothetical protein